MPIYYLGFIKLDFGVKIVVIVSKHQRLNLYALFFYIEMFMYCSESWIAELDLVVKERTILKILPMFIEGRKAPLHPLPKVTHSFFCHVAYGPAMAVWVVKKYLTGTAGVPSEVET